MCNILNHLLFILLFQNVKSMVVLSNFSDNGKKYYLIKAYCAPYTKVLNGGTGRLSNSDLFYHPPKILFFRKCIYPLCKTCPQASRKQILNDANLSPFCKAFKVIYKITCKLCGLIYIGETSTPLYLRINQHRSNPENYISKNNYCKSTVEMQHFNLHKLKNTSLEILKIHESLNEQLFLETSYVRHFNTVYPYGLNTKCYNKGVKIFSTLNGTSN